MAEVGREHEERTLATPRESWDPFRLLNEMFDTPLAPWFERRRAAQHGMLSPPFDVKESSEAYIIEADLPGMKEDDINVSLTENRLTISGKREAEREKKDEKLYTFERQFGSFRRSFTLPSEADAEHIDAFLEDGVLKVMIPKKEVSKPKRIELKRSSRGKASKH